MTNITTNMDTDMTSIMAVTEVTISTDMVTINITEAMEVTEVIMISIIEING